MLFFRRKAKPLSVTYFDKTFTPVKEERVDTLNEGIRKGGVFLKQGKEVWAKERNDTFVMYGNEGFVSIRGKGVSASARGENT